MVLIIYLVEEILMEQNKIYKLIFFTLVITVILNSCNAFAPGTYPYAEYYFLDIPKDDLIEKIEGFKTQYPHYRVMEIQADNSIKEKKDYYSYNFYIPYFYLSEQNLIMHCVIKKIQIILQGLGYI